MYITAYELKISWVIEAKLTMLKQMTHINTHIYSHMHMGRIIHAEISRNTKA